MEVEELVPEEGAPMIVVANHWNSAADVSLPPFPSVLGRADHLSSPKQVAVLSCYFPHYRKLHYWAKSTLFAPGLPRKILLDAGNLPVDRKTKVRLASNRSPCTVLITNAHRTIKSSSPPRSTRSRRERRSQSFRRAAGPSGLFLRYARQLSSPCTYSYTVHELPALKDGASWCALEYAKNLRDPRTRRVLSDGSTAKTDPKDVVISIAGIAYSDKTKYRSCAVME